MSRGSHRTYRTDEAIRNRIERLQEVIQCLEQVLDGENILTVCKTHGWSYQAFLGIADARYLRELAVARPPMPPLEDLVEYECSCYEKLYQAVFGGTLREKVEKKVERITLPIDYVEAMDQVLMTLTDREAQVLRMRFGFDGEPEMSLREIGDYFGVGAERARQIESKALRKLRHPSRWNVLVYGVSGLKRVEAKMAEIARLEAEKSLMLKIREQDEQIEKLTKEILAQKQGRKERLEAINGSIEMFCEILKEMSINDMDFSVRTFNCLCRSKVENVYQLAKLTEDDLMKIRNLGPTCLKEIRKKMDALFKAYSITEEDFRFYLTSLEVCNHA